MNGNNDTIFDIKGYFKIEGYNIHTNKLVYKFEDDNKIIEPTVEKFASSLMGVKRETDMYFNSIQMGIGGIGDDELAITPTGKEAQLKNKTREFRFNKLPSELTDHDTGALTISTINYKYNRGKFEFNISFDAKDANDKDTQGSTKYNEIGLFLQNGDMFAYRTFPTASKDESTKFVIKWNFIFYSNREENTEGNTEENQNEENKQ